MRILVGVVVIFVLLLVPAFWALGTTGRNYLAVNRDIGNLRFVIVDIRPDPNARLESAGPVVIIEVQGVRSTALTLAEVNFDLFWQNDRMAAAATLLNLPIPKNDLITITVPTSLYPAQATAMRALIARGEKGFTLGGNARVVLPGGEVSVWLTLRGQVRAAAPRCLVVG